MLLPKQSEENFILASLPCLHTYLYLGAWTRPCLLLMWMKNLPPEINPSTCALTPTTTFLPIAFVPTLHSSPASELLPFYRFIPINIKQAIIFPTLNTYTHISIRTNFSWPLHFSPAITSFLF